MLRVIFYYYYLPFMAKVINNGFIHSPVNKVDKFLTRK